MILLLALIHYSGAKIVILVELAKQLLEKLFSIVTFFAYPNP